MRRDFDQSRQWGSKTSAPYPRKHAVVGISGGLDSTLALIVTAKAFDMIGKDKKEILAITMPCFGTTDRTYRNACKMAEQLGATLREVKIADSVSLHFQDIGHDPKDHSVTYENAQARERTQVLMDIASDKRWSSEPEICQNWRLDGQPTMEIICRCTE